ncbi:MAG: hypothetical protein LCH76_03380 [Actinobacteria bacterium]|nr:hypothetical protein [Actinomycetota bacterium]
MLAEAGVRPGVPIEASLIGHDLILLAERRCVLPAGWADHIFVAVG